MKRREFITKGSLALAAVATSDLWLGRAFAGESMTPTSILDTYFRLAKADLSKVLSATLAKGAEFADVFFEYRISSNLSFEEDIVKSAQRGIVQGVGVRAVKGDQIGFAFTEDLSLASMLEAANAAAVIASDNTAKTRVVGVNDVKVKNLYPVAELATSTELTKKLGFIKEANAAAKAYDPKIVRVSVGFNDEVKHVADGIGATNPAHPLRWIAIPKTSQRRSHRCAARYEPPPRAACAQSD